MLDQADRNGKVGSAGASGRPRLSCLLRSACFWGAFALMIGALFLTIFVTRPSPARANGLARRMAIILLWVLETMCGLRYRIAGDLESGHASRLVAVQHQSTWETIALLALLREPAFIVKAELLSIPLLGWLLRYLGHVPTERDGEIGSALKATRALRDRIAEGRQIVIFPQGSRVMPEEQAKYHTGVYLAYRLVGEGCLPVALDSGRFWPPRSFAIFPGRVTLEILPPIAPGLTRNEFMARLAESFEGANRRTVQRACA